MDWNPRVNGSVTSLAVAGDTVYVGGGFERAGGERRRNLAAIDAATGRAKPWNPGADSYVWDLVVHDGTVYAAGSFSTIGGQPRKGLAALDAESGRPRAWAPDLGIQNAHVVALGDKLLYVRRTISTYQRTAKSIGRGDLFVFDVESGAVVYPTE